MTNISKLTEILRDAISDYAAHAEEKSPAEWLQGYLGEKLPEKSSDAIHSISSEILSTLDLMEEKKAALDAAIDAGESAEGWFTKEVMNESEGNGYKARKAVEFVNGIASAEQNSTEFIDVNELEEDFSDENWNDYKLKDTLKNTAVEAGKAGMREIASDIFLKASEEGIASVLKDSDFIKESLGKGAVTGLKTAVAAGLAVAEESGVVPPSTFAIIATTAHKTVESFSAFVDVIKGQKTMTEAIVEIKNTAVSTFSAMWKQHGQDSLYEIQDVAIAVFGVKGAAVSGAVIGLLTPAQEGSKLAQILEETGKAILKFFTKERHLPNFNKNKTKVLN